MMNMLRKKYSEEWSFFKRRLFRIFLVLWMLSLVTIAISYDHYSRHPDKIRVKLSVLREYSEIHDLAGKTRLKRCAKLLLNNVLASMQAIALGVIPFFFLPVIFLIVTSAPAGLVVAANQVEGLQSDLGFIVQRLLPHGIFEFGAIVYASSIGVYLTIQVSRKLIPKYRPDTSPLNRLFMQVARGFLLVVVPFLSLAAVVQAFITPK